MQNWMQRSQNALAQWFDAQTARALDAFIEDDAAFCQRIETPLAREAILQMINSGIAGESMSCHSASGQQNPPTLNRNGGVDGLHKWGHQKSGGNRSHD